MNVETLKGLAKLEENVVERKTNLRKQLDAVATRLEEGHAELQGSIARAAQAPQGPPPAGEAGALSERLRIMGEKMDVQLASMGKIVGDAGTRVGVLEINATTTAHSMQDVQGMVTVITAGLNEVTVEIQNIKSSAGQGQQDRW